MVFVVYWCYGTQLSVNAAATADFFGAKNAGMNYGMLFTAWGVAGSYRPEDRRRAVRQVQELSDGVLHGCGFGGSGIGRRTVGSPSKTRLTTPRVVSYGDSLFRFRRFARSVFHGYRNKASGSGGAD